MTNKRKASDESTEDQHRPICNVQGQRIKQRSAQSMSQPELPAVARDNAKSEPPRKRPSLEMPISASAPSHVQDHREFKKPQLIQEHATEKLSRKSKPKKVAFKPQPEQFELADDSFSFSPEKSDRKTKPRSRQQPVEQPQNRSSSPPPQPRKPQPPPFAMDFEPQVQQQQTVDDDNFSFGSASPPLDSRQSKDDGGSFFDTGSISSFDMDLEDRESGSDLGFDLSPVGPRTKNRRDEHGEEGSGSDDFDFLASPPKSAAPPGSQGGGRKGQDSFSFTDEDDSGTGFDFF